MSDVIPLKSVSAVTVERVGAAAWRTGTAGYADVTMLAAYRTPDRLRARIAFHERFGGEQEDFHRWLFAHVGAPRAARVLEVGSGTSRLWAVNADEVPPGWRLTLTDISEGMLDATREVAADAGLSVGVLRVDVQDLPFADGSFDLAFANHMLYHLPDLDRGVAELRRVLTPGGLLVAATNGEAHLLELRELLAPLAGVVEAPGVGPLGFTLEEGAARLRSRFEHVETHRRDDAVLVDDPDVLLAYLRSLVYLPEHPDDALPTQLAAWEEGVRARLAGGPLTVRRSTGFFLAR